MDGLLLDSEPYWKESEIEVFTSLGVPLTGEMCDTTVGKRIGEVVSHWHKLYPWDTNKKDSSFEKVSENVIAKVVKLINKKGTPLEGVDYIIKFFKDRKIKTAIASSSAMIIIDAALQKFKIKKEFDAIHSAEKEQFGKPHPAVYLNTAKQLGTLPKNCLAFEDSFNGLLSAKDAGMKTVAVPEKRFFNEERFSLANIKLSSLKQFDMKHLEMLNKL